MELKGRHISSLIPSLAEGQLEKPLEVPLHYRDVVPRTLFSCPSVIHDLRPPRRVRYSNQSHKRLPTFSLGRKFVATGYIHVPSPSGNARHFIVASCNDAGFPRRRSSKSPKEGVFRGFQKPVWLMSMALTHALPIAAAVLFRSRLWFTMIIVRFMICSSTV